MRVVNTDKTYYLHKSPEKSFLTAEQDKKRKYPESCLQQQHHLYPFTVLVEIFLKSEVEVMMKILARCISIKWWQPYLRKYSYVWSRVSIKMVRATHR